MSGPGLEMPDACPNPLQTDQPDTPERGDKPDRFRRHAELQMTVRAYLDATRLERQSNMHHFVAVHTRPIT